jgi:glycosyltransferase involved in cell wall biosynthesis
MRLVIAGQTYYPRRNGQAVFTTRLAEGLAQAGHEVLAIAPATHSHPKPFWHNKVRVHTVSAFQIKRWHPELHVTLLPDFEVNQVLEDFQPDLAHIQDHYPISAAVARWMHARHWPVVATNHFLPDNIIQNSAWLHLNRPLVEWVLWHWMLNTYNHVQAVTTPTRTAARILQSQAIERQVLPISCGVDTQRFRPIPSLDRTGLRQKYGLDPVRPLLLYVGRLDHEKRIDVLLRAVRLTQCDDYQLAVAGRGVVANELHTLAHDLHLEDRVKFIGFVPDEDLPALYNSADFFVMPSTAELQSIATLEALSCGKPVICANARALPELVTEGVNGYLFKPDDPVDAARRIDQLLRERERWAAMGQASLAIAAHHSLNHTLRHYEEVYTSLIHLRNQARPTRLASVQRFLGLS